MTGYISSVVRCPSLIATSAFASYRFNGGDVLSWYNTVVRRSNYKLCTKGNSHYCLFAINQCDCYVFYGSYSYPRW